jgi:hypothetical protein
LNIIQDRSFEDSPMGSLALAPCRACRRSAHTQEAGISICQIGWMLQGNGFWVGGAREYREFGCDGMIGFDVFTRNLNSMVLAGTCGDDKLFIKPFDGIEGLVPANPGPVEDFFISLRDGQLKTAGVKLVVLPTAGGIAIPVEQIAASRSAEPSLLAEIGPGTIAGGYPVGLTEGTARGNELSPSVAAVLLSCARSYFMESACVMSALAELINKAEGGLKAEKYTIEKKKTSDAIFQEYGYEGLGVMELVDRMQKGYDGKDILVVTSERGMALLHQDNEYPELLRAVVIREELDLFYRRAGIVGPLCEVLMKVEVAALGFEALSFPFCGIGCRIPQTAEEAEEEAGESAPEGTVMAENTTGAA